MLKKSNLKTFATRSTFKYKEFEMYEQPVPCRKNHFTFQHLKMYTSD